MFDSSSDDADSSSDDEHMMNPVQPSNESNTNAADNQWIQFIEYCSYRCNFQNAVPKGVGVEKLCQATDVDFGNKDQIEKGWILSNNNREESLIVSFQTPVFINEIHIYESLNPGSIVKLEMLESLKDHWRTMWQQKSLQNTSLTHNIFKPVLRRYHFRSNTIRITIDPRHTDRIGLQAIKLIGSNVFDVKFQRTTMPDAMQKLYQQTLDNSHCDIQFLIENHIINAHRNILSCRSAYFRALLLDDFIEKHQGKPIELTDVDRHTFVELLYFIYTGTYRPTMSYDTAIQCMLYSNKINFLSGRDSAVEKLCYHLRSKHHYIIPTYSLLKQLSPTFDFFLDYIYNLCSQCIDEICQQKEFSQLDKDLVIDLICHSTKRMNLRQQGTN